MRVRGAACLVTGGSSGIGRATAIELAARGARVLVAGRDAARVRETAEACGGRGVVADLSSLAGIERVAAEAHGVDVLVNNAGIGWAGSFAEMTAAEADRLVLVNVRAPALLARALVPGMLARGRGHVVNVASVAGHVPVGGEALYAATKAALVSLTGGLRQELAGSPVRVTLVSPGPVDTPLFENRGLPYRRERPGRCPRAASPRRSRGASSATPGWSSSPGGCACPCGSTAPRPGSTSGSRRASAEPGSEL